MVLVILDVCPEPLIKLGYQGTHHSAPRVHGCAMNPKSNEVVRGEPSRW